MAEFIRMRADSSVEAQRNTTFAWNSIGFFVCASRTRTPVILRAFGSKIRLCTMLNGRSVIFPVASADGSVEFKLLKYERVIQPRAQGPQ